MKKRLLIVVAILMAVAMFASCSAPAAETAAEAQAAEEAPVAVEEAPAAVEAPAAAEAPAAEAPAASSDGPVNADGVPVTSEWSMLPLEPNMVDFSLDPAEVAEKGYTIGFSQCVMDHPYRTDMVDRARAWCEEYGVGFEMMDGQGQPATETSNVESLIAKKVDAIVISSHAGVALTPAIAQANDAGIPVVLIDGGKPFDDWDFVTWMSTDDWQLGQLAGRMLVDEVGEGQVIMIEGTSGSSCTEGRRGGFLEILDANPGIELVATQDGNFLRKDAMDIVSNLLTANPDIKAVYTHNDEMAIGAIEAIEKAGKVAGEDILVYSAADYQENAFEEIREGKLQLTQIYRNDGDYACQAAVAALMGMDVPNRIQMGTEQATQDNVDTRTFAY